MATEVVGREQELASIEEFLDGIEARPWALVLSGEPGIGKTVLWERGVEEAKRRFGRVLTCRGVEAEASLSFASLSELLGSVLDETAPSLLPLRRRALEVALLIVEPGDDPPDPHAIGLAVLDVLRALAASGPLLVALDDLQWLDPASAGALQLALRRLRDEPIAVLATLRAGPESVASFPLDRSFREERLMRLAIGPLSAAALRGLLKQRIGLELTRPELSRVREATSGNPFFALELGRELVRTRTRPAPGRALRVPDSLRELLGGRLARLPPETVDVLVLIAALARPTVELVAAAHGDRECVLRALEVAGREGVVELDGSCVCFAHPMLASICYEQAPVWRRRTFHRAIAGAVVDREERARHLALAAAGPDASIAAELAAAAGLAAARGATATGAELAEFAAELTAEDPASVRARRLQAARFHRLAGNGERAIALLEQLRTDAPPGLERADVLFALAMTLKRDPRAMIELCEEALGEARADDARSARILAFLTWAHLFEGDVSASLACARAAREKAERVGDPALLAVAIARAGHAELWACDVTPGLLERGAEIEARLGRPLEYLESPRVPLGRLLMRLGELDRARMIFGELEADMAARGDEGSRVEALWTLSMLEWLAGRWQRALDLGAAAQELAQQIQFAHAGGWVGRVKALIETDLGLVDEARESAEECLAFAQAGSNDFYTIVALGALGRLELALGDLEAAGTHLRELPRRLLAGGLNDPTAPVWADAIETLIRLGELELAGSYLDHYEDNARRLRSPPAIAGAARCRGLLAAAEGDLAGAFAAYRRSLAELDRIPQPLELGRTLLCLGSAHRRARQNAVARDALGQALAIFEELGAKLWAEQARAELRRISGRRRGDGELTETETRAAELAAQGRTNKQIAAELFMGVSTVEMHLSRVYRKLGIRSRTELARRLTPASDDAHARS
jgi:ATP/maltotriose-dependent transcriptional regulator MalT